MFGVVVICTFLNDNINHYKPILSPSGKLRSDCVLASSSSAFCVFWCFILKFLLLADAPFSPIKSESPPVPALVLLDLEPWVLVLRFDLGVDDSSVTCDQMTWPSCLISRCTTSARIMRYQNSKVSYSKNSFFFFFFFLVISVWW